MGASPGSQDSNWEGLAVHPVLWARGPHPHTTLVRSEIIFPRARGMIDESHHADDPCGMENF